jgi:TfoX/Sxy family transcriptional regulator of competence genes
MQAWTATRHPDLPPFARTSSGRDVDRWRLSQDTCAMAYDEELANRLRQYVHGEEGVSEKRMFGGLAFLINGNMAVSASSQGGLLLRVDPAQTDALVSNPGAERFVMRGREMDGWLRIDADAVGTDDELLRWISHGVAYARSLPPK